MGYQPPISRPGHLVTRKKPGRRNIRVLNSFGKTSAIASCAVALPERL
jgi:hypothetical protein